MGKNTDTRDNYEDIIHLPHPVSAKRPHMSLLDRAAQFSPFSALTGYDEVVKETARLTDRCKELDECERAALDEKLGWLQNRQNTAFDVTVSYFEPDAKKDGGKYVTVTGRIKKIDALKQCIYMTDGERIPIQSVVKLEGAVFGKEPFDFE